jgi:DNA-binding MarR family transcriptional regulator
VTAAAPKKVRAFYCPPTEALSDTNLTALDHRILGVICLHDGMSRLKGNGAGCYASYKTLAAIVDTDITNFSKGISKLVGAGYISREPQKMDKRRYTLRVEYRANVVGEMTNNQNEIVGEAANHNAKVVGEADFETRGNPDNSDAYYISLKEELDSVETGEIDSDESARLKRGINHESKPETAEVLRRLERDLKNGFNGYPEGTLPNWSAWAYETYEHYFSEDIQIAMWAQRLCGEINHIIEQRDDDDQLSVGEPW